LRRWERGADERVRSVAERVRRGQGRWDEHDRRRISAGVGRPGLDFSTYGDELYSVVNTPLLTGIASWIQDFPNPWHFMELFTCSAGTSLDYGYVCIRHYDSTLNALDTKPPASVASQWSALDNYAVSKGYYAAYGHQAFPKFYSDRLVFSKGVISVEYETDLTSLELRK
jgi:hypothetical protein